MHAYIGVVNHPFFAVSAGGGTFNLRDVPPAPTPWTPSTKSWARRTRPSRSARRKTRRSRSRSRQRIDRVHPALTSASDIPTSMICTTVSRSSWRHSPSCSSPAGGMVTSTGSGLSAPDWPTTYGWNMFTFPLSKWVGGIRYEHFHRLVASTVGCLTIDLAVWTWRVDTRRWVRSWGGRASAPS